MQEKKEVVNPSQKEIENIFKDTKTIAIVGCSPNESKPSNMVAKYLQKAGFRIVPVYPRCDQILGEKVYVSLKDVPVKIDMVNIFRKASAVEAIIDEAIQRGDVDTVWLQLGIINNAAILKAKGVGLNAIQNKCTKIEHELIFG